MQHPASVKQGLGYCTAVILVHPGGVGHYGAAKRGNVTDVFSLPDRAKAVISEWLGKIGKLKFHPFSFIETHDSRNHWEAPGGTNQYILPAYKRTESIEMVSGTLLSNLPQSRRLRICQLSVLFTEKCT